MSRGTLAFRCFFVVLGLAFGLWWHTRNPFASRPSSLESDPSFAAGQAGDATPGETNDLKGPSSPSAEEESEHVTPPQVAELLPAPTPLTALPRVAKDFAVTSTDPAPREMVVDAAPPVTRTPPDIGPPPPLRDVPGMPTSASGLSASPQLRDAPAPPTATPESGASQDKLPALPSGPAGTGRPHEVESPPISEEQTPAGGPDFLKRPLESPPVPEDDKFFAPAGDLYLAPVDPPIGFAGRSGILPREEQTDNHFVPMEDRWRIGFPEWDRYGKGHPPIDDYPYKPGSVLDPYNQNVLKGDYAIWGQNTFFVATATSRSLVEYRSVPIATTPFESTRRPFENEFFGRPAAFLYSQFLALSLDLFQGDAAFRPVDWRVKVTPMFNFNLADFDELAVVNPNVIEGTTRRRTWVSLEEWFVETKLADISPDYDFVSLRIGSQPFTSDFRGFIFSDINRGIRLFGNRNANREQFNLVYFRQQEKDTNSGLNSFDDRRQDVVIGNYYIQDFIFPGYTAQFSVHYNHDQPTFLFDKNSVLVRPDPVGVFKPHTLDVVYLGWTGDGHINRFNISHAFYLALGHDTLNPIANQSQDICAEMAALEVSYDRDWIRFRTSFFWASGDENTRNSHATGFDAIFDNPNFAGGEFSYWQRQAIRLFGVNLVNRESLLPDLKSSKIQGQSNFVNPGLYLANFGLDFDVTPKFRVITNVNLLWFDTIDPLRKFTFAQNIDQHIGTDISMGIEYRPLLSNNVIFVVGAATLIPGQGFQDLFNNLRNDINPLVAGFVDLILQY